jgi:hypothetical protein
MVPVQELTKAGVDRTKPNRHGVSPLLLLLRHTSDGKLLPAAVQDELLHGVWKQNWSRQVCALRWLRGVAISLTARGGDLTVSEV